MGLFSKKNKEENAITTDDILMGMTTSRVSINPEYLKNDAKKSLQYLLYALYSGDENYLPLDNMTNDYYNQVKNAIIRDKNNGIKKTIYDLQIKNVRPTNVDNTMMYLVTSVEFEIHYVVSYTAVHSTFDKRLTEELKVRYLFMNGKNYPNKKGYIIGKENDKREISSTQFDVNAFMQEQYMKQVNTQQQANNYNQTQQNYQYNQGYNQGYNQNYNQQANHAYNTNQQQFYNYGQPYGQQNNYMNYQPNMPMQNGYTPTNQQQPYNYSQEYMPQMNPYAQQNMNQTQQWIGKEEVIDFVEENTTLQDENNDSIQQDTTFETLDNETQNNDVINEDLLDEQSSIETNNVNDKNDTNQIQEESASESILEETQEVSNNDIDENIDTNESNDESIDEDTNSDMSTQENSATQKERTLKRNKRKSFEELKKESEDFDDLNSLEILQ